MLPLQLQSMLDDIGPGNHRGFLVRLALGLEDSRDLAADLDRALHILYDA